MCVCVCLKRDVEESRGPGRGVCECWVSWLSLNVPMHAFTVVNRTHFKLRRFVIQWKKLEILHRQSSPLEKARVLQTNKDFEDFV